MLQHLIKGVLVEEIIACQVNWLNLLCCNMQYVLMVTQPAYCMFVCVSKLCLPKTLLIDSMCNREVEKAML